MRWNDKHQVESNGYLTGVERKQYDGGMNTETFKSIGPCFFS